MSTTVAQQNENNSTGTIELTNWRTFNDDRAGISFEYHSKWSVDKNIDSAKVIKIHYGGNSFLFIYEPLEPIVSFENSVRTAFTV